MKTRSKQSTKRTHAQRAHLGTAVVVHIIVSVWIHFFPYKKNKQPPKKQKFSRNNSLAKTFGVTNQKENYVTFSFLPRRRICRKLDLNAFRFATFIFHRLKYQQQQQQHEVKVKESNVTCKHGQPGGHGWLRWNSSSGKTQGPYIT